MISFDFSVAEIAAYAHAANIVADPYTALSEELGVPRADIKTDYFQFAYTPGYNTQQEIMDAIRNKYARSKSG